jgi:uncharacterized protein YjbJ (UPF0337 family)
LILGHLDNATNKWTEGGNINWEQAKGRWNKLKGPAKAKWGRLTDDTLEVIAGQREHLIRKIQVCYGVATMIATSPVARRYASNNGRRQHVRKS